MFLFLSESANLRPVVLYQRIPRQDMFDDLEGVPLFADAAHLSGDSAPDVKTKNSSAAVPSPHVFLGGFPCTDVSRKNPKRTHPDNVNVVKEKGMKTGAVFNHIVEFYEDGGLGEEVALTTT